MPMGGTNSGRASDSDLGAGGERASFDMADLRRANMGNAKMELCTFREALMQECEMDEGVEARDAVFRNANLSEAVLQESDFTRSDFREATLNGTYMELGVFDYCDFRGADLTGAYVWCASFFGAEFLGDPDGNYAVKEVDPVLPGIVRT